MAIFSIDSKKMTYWIKFINFAKV